MTSSGLHIHPGEDIDDLLDELRKADHEKVDKVTLYNLKVSRELAQALLDFRRAHYAYSRRTRQPTPKPLTLEILGCTGCLDRLLECFGKAIEFDDGEYTTEEEDGTAAGEQELILQHSHPDHFDLSVFVALGMTLSSNQTKEKQTIRLFQPILSEAKVWALCQGIQKSQHLKELDLSSCRFAPLKLNNAIRFLSEGFRQNQHLKCLQFADCDLSDDQIECLLDGLQGHPTLTILNLAGNKCRSKGMIALSTAFSTRTAKSTNRTLSPLSINLANQHVLQCRESDNKLDYGNFLDAALVKAWQCARAFTNRLVTLNLSQNRLNDKDMAHIVAIIFTDDELDGCSTSIQELDVSRNDFTDRGIQCMAGAIKRCRREREDHGRGFRRLNICGCPGMTKVAFESLADAVAVNVDLEEIYCTPSSNPIIPRSPSPEVSSITSAVERIQYYTMLNKGGRKVFGFDRSDNVTLALWPLILDRVNHKVNWARWQVNENNVRLNVLYNLLRQGPILTEKRR